MKPDDPIPPASLHLRSDAGERDVSIPVPPRRSTLLALLPSARAISEATTAMALEEHVFKGGTITCGPACGQCCRQLVPISMTHDGEAMLNVLVAELPRSR